ncbi:hypothetical protein M9H77_03686 [Catharanthus roseus]|uniref:Uncharacterized protein n=1 Tax=Catharanthus roseus TaxID=4058 RepID=A0ACC0CCD1_CATRO|nr:hypothetical protein M9H77_03686 [Catharanthus roseus]
MVTNQKYHHTATTRKIKPAMEEIDKYLRKKIEKCHTGMGIPRPYPRPWMVGSGSINFIPKGYGSRSSSMFHYKSLGMSLGVPRGSGHIYTPMRNDVLYLECIYKIDEILVKFLLFLSPPQSFCPGFVPAHTGKTDWIENYLMRFSVTWRYGGATVSRLRHHRHLHDELLYK